MPKSLNFDFKQSPGDNVVVSHQDIQIGPLPPCAARRFGVQVERVPQLGPDKVVPFFLALDIGGNARLL